MTASNKVVTRFAPSPTGYLHIGGARTALFNRLFARRHGGRFLLRIEDTDRARSTQAAVDAILEGLAWLGLDWDGEPLSQASRADRHAEAAAALLKTGRAYRCRLTPEEIETARAKAHETGQTFRSPWRDRDPGEAAADQPFVVRFKGPLDGETIVEDKVQGRVAYPNASLDDLVLLRSDGAPTYNLAVVVDDHDMGVTHVIRGDDHLNNAARQTLIYQALDWETPVWAHVPLIHGPDGKKLSKRHGALGVEAYRDLGMLPEGLRNYLLRLGWSHGDQELFTDDEAIAAFDLEGLNKAPARLDLDKMASVNAHHLKRADDARLAALTIDWLETHENKALDASAKARLAAAIPALKPRAKTVKELAEQAGFLLAARPLSYDDKTRISVGESQHILERLAERLGAAASWDEADLKSALDAFAAAEGVGFGKIGKPLRAALTAGAPAPDITAVLALLGREEALGRIGEALSAAA